MFLDDKKGWVDSFVEWSMNIFIALFPFIVYHGYLFYDTTTRFMNLVILVQLFILALSLGLIVSKRYLYIIKSPITLALILFLITSSLSGIFGVDFATSFWSKATRTAGLFYLFHLSVFYLFLVCIFKEQQKIINFIKIYLISAAIFSFGVFLGNSGLKILPSINSGFTFGNSTFASMYLFAAFLLSVYYVLTSEKVKNKWWRFFIPIIFIVNPYFINADLWFGRVNIFRHPLDVLGGAHASTYATLVSIFLLIVIYFISKLKDAKTRHIVICLSVISGIVVACISTYSLFSDNGYLRKLYLSDGSNARPIVWDLSEKAINERPLLGWGGDNFSRVFEKYYDNRLLEQKNGGEAWFDKAHNVFIDQTVDNGYIGLSMYILIYLITIGCMIFVLIKSNQKNYQYLAAIIIAYLVGHIVELQTAFDTTISYVPFIIMLALATIIFYKVQIDIYPNRKFEWKLSKILSFSSSIIISVIAVFGFVVGTAPLMYAEGTNGAIRTVGSSEKRILLYPVVFNSKLDPGAFLYRASYDLRRGIAMNSRVIEDPKQRDGFMRELDAYVLGYVKYIESHPYDYRAHLDFANVYIYQRLFEVNNLDKANDLLDKAIVLVPQAPQAYWMKSVVYLYQRKFDLAREWAKKAYDLNPNIEESKNLVDYINSSIKTFPVIDLYVFKQT